MNDDELRDLLSRVKAGDITPEDAAAALSGTRAEERSAEDTPVEETGPEPQDSSDFAGVRVVRLRATANRTKVIGDRAVRTVQVSGPHKLWIDGDTAVVENEIGEEAFGFGEGARHIRISGIRGAKIQGLRNQETLIVRVNPTMPVDFDCDAGMIEILGVASALSGRVNAANAIIDDFDGPFQLSVNAGKLRARGRLDGGESTLDVNVGKADVVLESGSNVRIVRTATFGSAESDDDVVGSGAGTLRITCSLGAVRVHSPEGSLQIKHRMDRDRDRERDRGRAQRRAER